MKRFQRIFCFVLVFSLLLGISGAALADADAEPAAAELTVLRPDGSYGTLGFYRTGGEYYVSLADLAELRGWTLSGYTMTAQGSPAAALFGIEELSAAYEGETYAPIEPALRLCGIELSRNEETGAFHAAFYPTLTTLYQTVFDMENGILAENAKGFSLSSMFVDVVSSSKYWFGLSGAKILSLFKNMSIRNAVFGILGKSDQKLYNAAMLAALSSDSVPVPELLTDEALYLSDALDVVNWAVESDGAMAEALSGYGIDLTGLEDICESAGTSSVVTAVGMLKDFEDLFKKYRAVQAVARCDERLIDALSLLRDSTSDKKVRRAAEKAFVCRWDTPLDVFLDGAKETASKKAIGLLEKQLPAWDNLTKLIQMSATTANLLTQLAIDKDIFETSKDVQNVYVFYLLQQEVESALLACAQETPYSDFVTDTSGTAAEKAAALSMLYLRLYMAYCTNVLDDTGLAAFAQTAYDRIAAYSDKTLCAGLDNSRLPEWVDAAIGSELPVSPAALPADYRVEVRSCTSDPTAPVRSLAAVGSWDGPCYYACRVLDASGNCIRESVFQANCISSYDDPPYELTDITRHGDLWLIQYLGYLNGIAVIFDAATGSILPLADNCSYFLLGDSYLLGVGLTGNPGVTITDHIYTWSGNYVRSFEEVAWGRADNAEYHYYTWEGDAFRVWKLDNATAESVVVRDFYGFDPDPFAWHDVTLYDSGMYMDGVYYSYSEDASAAASSFADAVGTWYLKELYAHENGGWVSIDPYSHLGNFLLQANEATLSPDGNFIGYFGAGTGIQGTFDGVFFTQTPMGSDYRDIIVQSMTASSSSIELIWVEDGLTYRAVLSRKS